VGTSGKRIIVLGELNVDVVASGLSHAPMLGKEILASDFQLSLGSASAIFACGAAKLGHEVTFVSTVGRDEFGDFCLRELLRNGISTRFVRRDKNLRTGVTVSLSTMADRALVTYPGAIAAVGPHLLKKSLLAKHQHLHMTSYFLQTGLRGSFAKIFSEAKKQGLTTSFDPNSDPSQTWEAEGLNDVLAHTDVLLVNKVEAQKLTRRRDTKSAFRVLSELVPCAVIKLGDKGAVAMEKGALTSAPAFEVPVKDTTGAGDSFAAGFVSSYISGSKLDDCLRTANACGALSTLKAGGTESQPNRKELKRFLKANQPS
jgi:sugar/nucleoside kinase (ribokinase family)